MTLDLKWGTIIKLLMNLIQIPAPDPALELNHTAWRSENPTDIQPQGLFISRWAEDYLSANLKAENQNPRIVWEGEVGRNCRHWLGLGTVRG
ncbi:hypothetical protein CEXT_393711 [Caerostris extrusa]|uniref:Uncharacterized protein n=1 Tax=Caerostris extrusa TaxID=172846 RepID=A0AAV4T808_CAEEX|nr:hypothetical protein CEXT_393711 [Caerostris extrusa]